MKQTLLLKLIQLTHEHFTKNNFFQCFQYSIYISDKNLFFV